jgi:predicted flap endonuclease-1-like 5' DNA nuclease
MKKSAGAFTEKLAGTKRGAKKPAA